MSRPRLDPRHSTPDIAPLLLVSLADLVKACGVVPERLCDGLGFSLEQLQQALPISDRQAWRMIRRALQLSGRSDLGLELGSRQTLSNFGLTGYAMAATRTLGEAIALGLQHQKQAGGLLDIEITREGELVALTATQRLRDDGVQAFLIEELFSSLLVLVRMLVGPGFQLAGIALSYPPPAHAERYRRVFECPLQFDAGHNRLYIARHWLEASILGHSPVMAAELRRLLAARESEPGPAVQAVATAVTQVLQRAAPEHPSIEQVARALELSVRTLRRRLQDAGTSFREIDDGMRAQATQQLLCEQGLTVAEASQRLGYSDVRAFRRAFKRWAGVVPGTVRHAARDAVAG